MYMRKHSNQRKAHFSGAAFSADDDGLCSWEHRIKSSFPVSFIREDGLAHDSVGPLCHTIHVRKVIDSYKGKAEFILEVGGDKDVHVKSGDGWNGEDEGRDNGE